MSEQQQQTSSDGIALLLDQHQQVKSLLDQVEQASGEQRQTAFDQLRRLLAVHETAEELVVRPLTRRVVPDGEAVADARISEENEGKDLLAELEKLGADAPDFEQKFGTLKQDVLKHAEAEEQEEFGPLRERIDDKQLATLAKALQAAEAAAPTHPHPSARSTAANVALGPIASVVDHVRDAIKKVTS